MGGRCYAHSSRCICGYRMFFFYDFRSLQFLVNFRFLNLFGIKAEARIRVGGTNVFSEPGKCYIKEEYL